MENCSVHKKLLFERFLTRASCVQGFQREARARPARRQRAPSDRAADFSSRCQEPQTRAAAPPQRHGQKHSGLDETSQAIKVSPTKGSGAAVTNPCAMKEQLVSFPGNPAVRVNRFSIVFITFSANTQLMIATVNQIRVILPFGLCIRSADQQRPKYCDADIMPYTPPHFIYLVLVLQQLVSNLTTAWPK